MKLLVNNIAFMTITMFNKPKKKVLDEFFFETMNI